jgi:hypothetical protein
MGAKPSLVDPPADDGLAGEEALGHLAEVVDGTEDEDPAYRILTG